MSNAMPELKKGDVITKTADDGTITTFTVIRVGTGTEFDEPVYYLQGRYGIKLTNSYTGEELASMGYRLRGQAACLPG